MYIFLLRRNILFFSKNHLQNYSFINLQAFSYYVIVCLKGGEIVRFIKKIIILFIMFFPCFVNASEYSEWSMEKPKEDKNIVIKSEERYLYYEMNEVNVEYKKFGESDRSNVSLEEYKLSEGLEYDVPIEETEHTVVTKDRKVLERYYDDVSYIRITNETSSTKELRIRDITLINNETNKQVSYELESFNNIVKLDENYYYINSGGSIFLKLDGVYNAYNLTINYTIPRDTYDFESKNILIEYLHEYTDGLITNFELRKNISVNVSNITDIPTKESSWWIRNDYYDVYYYLVQDKLYKYYDLERNDIGYYKELEGDYLRDPEPVIFYSYKVLEDKQEEINEEIKEDTSNKNDNIEYKCEYFYVSSFPLETDDKTTNYEVNLLEDETNENEESVDETSSLISYNSNDSKKCESCTTYKTFSLVSLICLIILIFFILVVTLVRRIRVFND